LSRYSEAIPKLKQALVLDNGHIKAALSLSSIYKGYGNIDRATGVISQCLETSKAPELIEALVKLFHQSSNHNQALSWAKKTY
jgi:lipopolysaccharide biosynthesis regulator YciM